MNKDFESVCFLEKMKFINVVVERGKKLKLKDEVKKNEFGCTVVHRWHVSY